ncbi:GLPGLI family protein [Dysgonomonas termitidis]|uniref:GLPGLI family protein n=1 Tax=Dysgonomonas termitidis TaxID=1516126 RepID=A0ABV9KX93_9BACT
MKKTILLLALSALSATVCSQQAVSVRKIDKGDIQQEKLDVATVRCYYKFTQPVTVDKQIHRQSDTMTLDIGQKVSRYYDAARIKRDSLFTDFMRNKLNPSTIQSISIMKDADMSVLDNKGGAMFDSTTKGETAQLFKKRPAGEIITIDRAESDPQKYKCTETIPAQQWDISTDTLTVLGYICQKATTEFRGRDYEAWFSPDIPVNEGPWKFHGLPGLIMKVSDSENLFSFEIIGLENLDNPVDITMAQEDYLKASIKDLDKLKKKQSGGTAINVNGGNVIMIQKKNNNEYLSLETE